jgi:hypothetical protein
MSSEYAVGGQPVDCEWAGDRRLTGNAGFLLLFGTSRRITTLLFGVVALGYGCLPDSLCPHLAQSDCCLGLARVCTPSINREVEKRNVLLGLTRSSRGGVVVRIKFVENTLKSCS